MKSFGRTQKEALDLAAARRPREIEGLTNLYFIHPASQALIPLFYRLGVSPNAVSALGALAAVSGAACFVFMPWPWSAVAGFALLVCRHILRGSCTYPWAADAPRRIQQSPATLPFVHSVHPEVVRANQLSTR